MTTVGYGDILPTNIVSRGHPPPVLLTMRTDQHANANALRLLCSTVRDVVRDDHGVCRIDHLWLVQLWGVTVASVALELVVPVEKRSGQAIPFSHSGRNSKSNIG